MGSRSEPETRRTVQIIGAIVEKNRIFAEITQKLLPSANSTHHGGTNWTLEHPTLR